MFRKTVRDLLKQIEEYVCPCDRLRFGRPSDTVLVVAKMQTRITADPLQEVLRALWIYRKQQSSGICARFCGSFPIDSSVSRCCEQLCKENCIKTNNCVWTLQIVFLSNIMKITLVHCEYCGQMRHIFFKQKHKLQQLCWLGWWESSRCDTNSFTPLKWPCGVTLQTHSFSYLIF